MLFVIFQINLIVKNHRNSVIVESVLRNKLTKIEMPYKPKPFKVKVKGHKVKVRFIPSSDGLNLCWLVVIDGKNNYANSVDIVGFCQTTLDEDKEDGTYYNNISCFAKEIKWIKHKCFIKTA